MLIILYKLGKQLAYNEDLFQINETNKHFEAIGREASHAKGKRMGGNRAPEYNTERNGRKNTIDRFFLDSRRFSM